MLIKIIEFDLPTGAGGMAAQMARSFLLKRLRQFKEDYKFEFHHNTNGYMLEVWFDDDKAYTIFVLTFDRDDGWRSYRLVEKEKPNERD